MSKTNGWRIAFAIAGLVLLLGPLFVRTFILGYNQRAYVPDETSPFSAASEREVPGTPFARPTTALAEPQELRPGPVVIDLAHGNGVGRDRFDPLADALADRGIGVRFWMSDIDPMTVTSFLDYPDQSEALKSMLRGASGLVVISPFFLWSKSEIAVAEEFVADGGRLLLISDPDVTGDLAQDVNNLGEPFGIVFAGDYLYDTTDNDENHIYVYAGDFKNDFVSLAGSRIAFYGARSISGDVTPQVVTSATTLSSLRTGLSGFSTVVKAGLASRGTLDGVLAMGDFDVLTAPFVERHDNALLTAFVADFLSSGERTQSVTDFPAWLGKDVTLVLANGGAVGGDILAEGSELQRALEDTGRTLSVAGTGYLTQTVIATVADEQAGSSNDMIVLADYALVASQTTLLHDLGFTLVEVTPTPAPTVTSNPSEPDSEASAFAPFLNVGQLGVAIKQLTPASSSAGTPRENTTHPSGDGAAVTPSATGATGAPRDEQSAPAPGQRPMHGQSNETPVPLLTPTATFTPTPIPTSTPSPTSTPTMSPVPSDTPFPTPSPTLTPVETPQPEVYLIADDGLRLVAVDTVMISQQQLADGRHVVAVMAYDANGIRSGVDRLLSGKFDGCITSVDLAVCSTPSGASEKADTAGGSAVFKAPTMEAVEKPTPIAHEPRDKLVMVIDDNDVTSPGETSEADIYIKVLAGEGYGPTLWTTAADGIPKLGDLTGYDWVIWSSGGYESGGPGLADLDSLLGYINGGGSLTISSRRPFFGMSTKAPSSVADVAVDDDLPPMVYGLPSTAIALEGGLPPVTPLQIGEEHEGAKIVLTRGPDSVDAGAPLLFVVIDNKGKQPSGARLMIIGMSLTWLPTDYSDQLVHNMAGYMTSD